MSKIMIFKLCFGIDYALKDYLCMISAGCVTSREYCTCMSLEVYMYIEER